jgi:hypothetical protein
MFINNIERGSFIVKRNEPCSLLPINRPHAIFEPGAGLMEVTVFKPTITLLLWLLAFFFAMANGILGLMVWSPLLGDYGNHLIKSLFAGLFFFFVLGWWHARLTRGAKALKAAWLTASIWLIATIVIELVLEVVMRGKSITEAISVNIRSYYFWEGQLWPIVLLLLFFGPVYWAWKLDKESTS